MQRARLYCLVVSFVFLAAVYSFAATQNAMVYGTVYDASGKALSGATVVISNPAIGLNRTTTSGSDGSYTFAEIPPAEGYELTALVGGRTIDIRVGITVNVGDERVVLPPLTQQPATVAAAAGPAPQVVKKSGKEPVAREVVSSAVSGVITGEQLRSLPLYNRNFLALGTLTPNTHDTQADSDLRGASFSVAGARPEQNNFLLDGSDNVAASSNQAIPFQVNDSIQEFRVVSSLATAEYGRNVGGVVNVVTRRGTRDFHGSAFGYFGNEALNADNPLSVYNGTGFDRAAQYAGPTNALPLAPGFASPSNYNEYVATAAALGYCTDSIGISTSVACLTGGTGAQTVFNPAAILATNNNFKQPFDSKQFGINMGKGFAGDKVFLFGSYEGTRINNNNPIFERVPSAFDRTFNPLLSRAVPSALPYNFTNTDPNYVLSSQILSLYPGGNVTGVPDALSFYQGFAPNYTYVNNVLGRVDYVMSNDTRMTVRYVAQVLNQLHDDTLPEQSTYPGNGALRGVLNQNFDFSVSHNFSNRMVNETRFSVTRFRVDENPQDGSVDATQFGLPTRQLPTFLISGIDPQYSGATNANLGGANGAFAGWGDAFWQFPSFTPMLPTLDGLFPMARIGAPLNAPSHRSDNTYLVADTLNLSVGKHALRMGGEFRILRDDFVNQALSRGYAVISNIGEFTSDSETCNQACGAVENSFFAPSFDYAVRQPAPYETNLRSWTTGLFLQDTFRIHPRVTLNLGLRYEYFSVPDEANNRLWNFDPAAGGLVQAGTTQVLDPFGEPCGPNPTNFANFPLDQGIFGGWNCAASGSGGIMNSDTNNFAPRVGLAWDVFGTGKSVFRAGIGWYYDQSPTSYISQLGYNRPSVFDPTNPSLMYGQNLLFGVPFPNPNPCPQPLNGTTQCSTGTTMLNPANITGLFQGLVPASGAQAMYARDVAFSDNAMSRQIAVSWQQSVNRNLTLDVGYIGSSARHLPVIYNAGFSNEWFCVDSAPFCDVNSNFPIFTMTNRGGASYNSLMVRVRAAQWHGLHVNATYNWSKSIDNASNSIYPLITNTFFNDALSVQLNGKGNVSPICLVFAGSFGGCGSISSAGGITNLQSAVTTTGAGQVLTTPYLIPQDPIGLAFLTDDRGRSDFDSRHRLVFDYTWDIPALKKDSQLWGGWQLSGIFTAQSGQPFTLMTGPVDGEIEQRVSATGPVTITGDPNAMISMNNLVLPGGVCVGAGGTTFANPGSGGALFDGTQGTACIGNTRRNEFTGPSYVNLNVALQKSFKVFGEGKTLSIRTEVYNLFNRDNFYNPISTLSLDGLTVNPDFGKVKSAHDPRQIQFAGRFTW